MARYDIMIIGSGMSGIATLKDILSELITNKVYKPLNIAVLEKQVEQWTGIPFGANLSPNCLTIQSIGEFFLNPDDKEEFIEWLSLNKEANIANYLEQGGYTAQEWYKHNKIFIDVDSWEPMFIPRYWYRQYITSVLQQQIQIATAAQFANLTTLQGEATHIAQKGGSYEVTVTNDAMNDVFTADRVVLAIGSPPIRPLAVRTSNMAFLHIPDLYLRKLHDSIEDITLTMQGIAEPQKRNLLIVGSNASCTELLYLIAHSTGLQQHINKIVVLSSSGSLPKPIDTADTPCPEFECLNALEQQHYTGTELIEATMADIYTATRTGVHTKNIEKLVNQAMQLKLRLTADERNLFETRFGTAVTASIRRMGRDYQRAITLLHEAGKLVLLKGCYSAIEDDNHSNALLHYTDEAGALKAYELPLAAAINCTGFELLDQCSSKLINSLLNEGLCKINGTKRGFEVNEAFEANENLYVMGPLLAGNNNTNVHYWHVENVARILQLSALFVPQLLQHFKMTASVEQHILEKIEKLKKHSA